MARYENEPWTHPSQPLPERKSEEIRSGETGEGGQKQRCEGFGRTIVKRRERDYNRPVGPAAPPPVRYRHSDFGHEKEGQLDILGDGFVLKSEGWTFWVMTRATFGREENHFAEFPAAPEL